MSELWSRVGKERNIWGPSMILQQISSSLRPLLSHFPLPENGDEVLIYYTLPREAPYINVKYFENVT
jgi:hypothetical protein